MSFNFGKNIRVSIFGESHGAAIGVVVDGLPAGVLLDTAALHAFLARRRPGGALSTGRKEADTPEFLSGLYDGALTGSPICAVIKNMDVKSADYEALKNTPRPGHADYPATLRFGGAADMRGGGSFSGRMTAPLCIAGGICLQLLAEKGVTVTSSVQEIAGKRELAAMEEAVKAAAAEGDSVGGIVECRAKGLAPGMGGHMFDGIENRIAAAIFGVPGVRGIEFGDGFEAARMRGSEHNDAYILQDGCVVTETNHCGGVLGGMTTGNELVFRVALKPTPSISKTQRTVNLETMKETEISISGRHDPCIVWRAAPAIEAAAAIALLDIILDGRTTWK
ncbi:Chorismate synthase [bioreactor metagenome]|uniref:chorismate synthase n=1 Tax=bioreactor metagenome TaxID=1076179 RepID=A0A644Z0F8_9ZZZZ